MKLHLPSSLRKALLSCLAAIASVLPSTLAAFTAGDIQWDSANVVNAIDKPADPGNNVDNIDGDIISLIVNGENLSYPNNEKYSFYNGSGKSLKVEKQGARVATGASRPGTRLEVTNLWLTNNSEPVGGAANQFQITAEGYLTDAIENIWIDQVGLWIGADQTGLRTNFSLGAFSSKDGFRFTNVPSFIHKLTLSIGADVSTTGHLEIQESVTILTSADGKGFTVNSLTGKDDADLTLVSQYDSSYLALTNGGEFKGKINFAIDEQSQNPVYNKQSNIRIGDDKTLNVKGITGKNGAFSAIGESGVAILKITGNDKGNKAEQISFSGIHLSLADNASQAFSSSTLNLTELTLGSNSTLDYDGTLTTGNITAGSGSQMKIHLLGDNKSALDISGEIALSDSNKIILNVSASDIALTMNKEGTTSYTLFSGASELQWADYFTIETNSNFGAEIVGANIVFTTKSKDYSWNNGVDNKWTASGSTGWRDGSATTGWENGNDAYFSDGQKNVTVSGEVVAVEMIVSDGNWKFSGGSDDSIVVSDILAVQNNSATFSGDLALTTRELDIADKATVTISTTGEKRLGEVNLKGANSRLIITDATNWGAADGQNSLVHGEGAMVFSGLNISGQVLANLLQNTLKKNASNEYKLDKLILDNGTDVIFNIDNAYSNYTCNVKDIYVEDGSSISTASNTLNTANNQPTLHLKGRGSAAYAGALCTNGPRAVQWGIVLEDHATIYLNGADIRFTNSSTTFNLNGHTLTFNSEGPAGILRLNDKAYAGSGCIDVQSGNIRLELSENGNRDTALINYSFNLGATSGSSLILAGTGTDRYTIRSLSSKGNNSLEMDNYAARVLQIQNEDKAASDTNTFAGTVKSGLTIALVSGYQKFSGTFENSTNFIAQRGVELAIAGTFSGKTHNLAVGEDSVMKLDGASFGNDTAANINTQDNNAKVDINGLNLSGNASITINVYDGGVITGATASRSTASTFMILAKGAKMTAEDLTLNKGEVLGFASTVTESNITLSGTTTLYGGSTLQFMVAEADNATDGWITGGSLAGYTVQEEGKIVFKDTSESEVKIALDPYDRMKDGEVRVLKAGSYTLIEGIGRAGMSEKEKYNILSNLAQATTPYARLEYNLAIDDNGNLIVEVLDDAHDVSWNYGSGTWNTNESNTTWKMGGTTTYFVQTDSVTFDTQKGTSGTVNVVIDHGESDDQKVIVGAITVKGSTSYKINGTIYGYNENGITDKGLQVGTAYETFTGTLTLTSDNEWYGDNTISSGTVIALTPHALSDVTTNLAGGELQLDYEDGEEFGGTLAFTGGTLTAQQSAKANATIADATLNAATDATLTIHRMEGSTAGTLRINYDTKDAGAVRLCLDTAVAGASALQVSSGDFTLTNTSDAKEVAFNVAGTLTTTAESAMHVSSGVALSGSLQIGGSIELANGSSLKDTGAGGTVRSVESNGAGLSGTTTGNFTTVEQLTINGDTTTEGNLSVRKLTHKAGGITIASGTTSITPTTDTQADKITVQNGAALQGGTETASLTLNSLSLGSAATEDDADATTEAATLAAGSNLISADVSIANGIIEKDANLTITDGGHGTATGEGTNIAGRITLAGDENAAELIISDEAALTGELLILNGKATISSDKAAGSITLASADAALDLTGSAASSTITMTAAGAAMLHAGSFAGAVIVDDRESQGAYDLGGITTGSAVQLRSLQGKSYVSGINKSLHLTGDSLITLSNNQRDRENTLIRFDSGNSVGELTRDDNATLTINVSGIARTVTKAGAKGVTYYVFNKGVQGNIWNAAHTIFQAELALYQMDVSFSSLDGSLTFTYTGPMGGMNIYMSTEHNDEHEMVVNSYDEMENYAGVVLDTQTHADLTGMPIDEDHPNGLVLKNFTSTIGSDFTVDGAGADQTVVTIRNTISDDQIDAFLQDHPNLEHVENIFTVAGDVNMNNATLRIKHVSDNDELLTSSRTKLTGELTIQGGELQVLSGELELSGGAQVEDVTFSGMNGQMIINACTAAVNSISVSEPEEIADTTHAEHIRIENNGRMLLRTGAQIGEHVIIGNTDAEPQEMAGSVNVSGRSAMSESAELHRIVLDLEKNSHLHVSSAAAAAAKMRATAEEAPSMGEWDLAGLSGEGALSTAAGRDIHFTVAGENHTFAGSLADYDGTMTFGASDYTQIFSGVVGGDHWNLTNEEGGRVALDLMGGRASNTLNMGNLTLQSGSITTIELDLAGIIPGTHGLHLNTLTIEDAAEVTLKQYNKGMVTLESEDGYVLIKLGELTAAEESRVSEGTIWKIEGVRNVTDAAGFIENGDLYIRAMVTNTNLYAEHADNENSAAGAKMLWSIDNSAEIGGDIAALDDAVYGLLAGNAWKTPGNVSKANKLLAAAAGASTAALGEALSADIERQLRAVRNRTTNLSYDEASKSGAWLNAESNYHKQSGDGLLPGYKLNGWGGTVGAHTTVNRNASLGIALTAMYNDVESTDADRIKGDMDNYYLSGFAQVAHGAWRHTLVATVGTASLDVNRTVSYETGSYTTKGSTDGFAFGMLYEVGYTMPLKEDYSLCLQPVFNVAWRSGSLDSYTETGASNAKLNVAEQSYNTITFGLGARMQAAVGSRAWNRTGLLEARALVKVDAGDRQGEVETAFVNVPSASRGTVKSAERGAVGVELGAGLTIPTGAAGAVFADFSAELRADYTNLNVTAGYKINF